MNLIIFLLGFNVFHVFGYFSSSHHKINGSEAFPFKNYYLVSTRVSKRSKRDTKFDECINLKFSNNDYKMCIKKYNITDNGVVNHNTTFIVCNENTTNTYKIEQFKIQFVKGYILDKPYTSSFTGYINNKNLYGKMEVDSKIFYIDPLHNFALFTSKNITENAIMYEIPFEDHHGGPIKSSRKKRSTKTITGQQCSLMVLIDNSFLRIVGKNNIKSSIKTVLHSLDLANSIFRITDFNNDGNPDNIGFTAKYVIVLESENTAMNKLPVYSNQPIDGKLYLFALSKYELLAEVCLGVAFTAQPFKNKVLGLSYTGIKENFTNTVPISSTGGICERPSRIPGEGSYNNLVISYRLENDESVPQITSDLGVTHELGHSFGSDHDTSSECMSYIMAPHTSENIQEQNFLFSDCSKKQIYDVLKFKGSCLEDNTEPFCGNGIVERDEDCDCGLTFTCLEKDLCCVAKNSMGRACVTNKNAGFQCHPSQGLCCASNCRYRDVSHLGLNCENFNNAKCPCQRPDTICSCGIEGTCINDECHSIECARLEMKECQCKVFDHKLQKCETCCIGPEGKCLPAKILTKRFAFNEDNINKLKRHSIDSFNVSWRNYEKYCIASNACVTVLFRSFNKGSFCLSKGQLGVCQNDLICNTNVGSLSKIPEIANIRKKNSGNIYGKTFFTLVLSNLLFLL